MLQVGQVLSVRYQLQKKLGQDASRQTWLAVDLGTQPQEQVVVKLLALSPQMHWDECKLFEREAQVLQNLDHPRIPKYRDYFVLDHQPDSRFPWFGLVESYIPGASLQQLLNQGHRFSEAQVEKIAVEVLTILVYLHELDPPVLHRDIKPSNLIWGEDERVYLVDFGAVQDQAAAEGATFTVVGTYGYVPMEQFGGRATPASDLYALGATLIHLLTGIAPADLPQRDSRIEFGNLASLDLGLMNWIGKLTEPDLANRLSTARQALEALKNKHALSPPVTNRKPVGSQIQLNKSASQLKIEIPRRGLRALSALYLLGSSMIFLPQLLNLSNLASGNFWLFLILCIWSYTLVLLLLPAFQQTYIYFDRQHFEIRWKLFGLRYWWRRGKTAKIRSTIGVYEADTRGSKGIAIQAENRVYTSNPVAEVERVWLIQEIQDWLDPERSHTRQTTRGVAEVYRPEYSRVEVSKSPNELLIKYPGAEKYWLIVALSLPLLFPISFLLFLILALLISPFLGESSVTVFSILGSLLGVYVGIYGRRWYSKRFPTFIRFNRDKFVIYKKLAGFTLEVSRGWTIDIQDVVQNASHDMSEWRIILQARTKDPPFGLGWSPFGLGLSRPERNWLIHEIKDWLKLK